VIKAVRAAKLVGVTIHCLRHSWASRLAESSGALLLLQQGGGWSSSSMVQRCAHLREGRGAEAIRKMLADRERAPPVRSTQYNSGTSSGRHIERRESP
jgi:integrase